MRPRPSTSAIVQSAFVMVFALGGVACGTSRPTSSDGYSVRETSDGNITISVGEDASVETMTAALMAAAQLTAWEPPETAPHLRQVEQTDMGEAGTIYRYRMDDVQGRFDVYVYRHSGSVEAQVTETKTALGQLVTEGRIERFAVVRPQEAQEITWNGHAAVLHRVVFSETVRGAATDSYMYLLEDDLFWIKVRASIPSGQKTVADMDALVHGLLGASPDGAQ
ncbi:MAG TPA: hypothetical protein VF594_01865 [Rubricoccaceae bacterium]|jgi:hypothetical protein